MYSQWPSASRCGHFKTKHCTQGQPQLNPSASLPKKGKSHDQDPEGSVFIHCLNLGTELWPRRYLGGLMWRMKSSGNAEWIWSIRGNTVGESSAVTDCVTGVARQVSNMRPLKWGGYTLYGISVFGNHFCTFATDSLLQFINKCKY